MKFVKILAGFAAACLIGSGVSAATVKVDFTATINNVGVFAQTPLAVGQKLSGSYTYDDSQPDQNTRSWAGMFQFQNFSINNDTLGIAYNVVPTGNNFISINDYTTDRYFVSAGAPLDNQASVQLGGVDPTASAFSQTSLSHFRQVLSNVTPSTFIRHYVDMAFRGVGGWGRCASICRTNALIDTVTFSTLPDNITPVPVPAALPLMDSGLRVLVLPDVAGAVKN